MPLLLFVALLPALLSLGVAAQAAGVYLAGLIPALYLWYKNAVRWRHREALRAVGAILITSWLLFPLSNLFNVVLPLGPTASALPWPMSFSLSKLFESRLSSATLVTGLLALLVAGVVRRSTRRVSLSGLSARRTLWWFVAGLFVASTLLGVYLALQTSTGLELRSPTRLLAIEHKTLGGFYRVFGFFGHPLSVAGVSLLWFSFSWMLLWSWFSERSYGNTVFLRGFAERGLPGSDKAFPLFLGALSFLHFAFVVLSGGRTALLVACFVLVAIPNVVPLRGLLRKLRFVLLGLGVPLAAAAAWAGGFLNRFTILVDKLNSGMVADDRLLFWKTHLAILREKPWIGQGHYWLENGVRKEYYARLGYTRLAEQKNFNAHNLYLETLADIGVLGAVVIVILVGLLFRRMWRRSGHLPVSRMMFWGVTIGFLANLLHGLTENTYFVSNIALPYLALLWIFLWVSFIEESSAK